MTVVLETERSPIIADADGVWRMADTRVTFDTVVAAFERGATPEEIVYQYPALALPDVYYAVSYYLLNRPAAQRYLEERWKQIQTVREKNEARFSAAGVRERLLSRRVARKGMA